MKKLIEERENGRLSLCESRHCPYSLLPIPWHTALNARTKFVHRLSTSHSTFEHGIIVFRRDKRRVHAHGHCCWRIDTDEGDHWRSQSSVIVEVASLEHPTINFRLFPVLKKSCLCRTTTANFAAEAQFVGIMYKWRWWVSNPWHFVFLLLSSYFK